MQQPLQITMRDVDHSDAVEKRIHEKAEKLIQHSKDLISCHITVERSQKRQTQGKLHNVRVYATIPGHEIAVNRNEAEDIYVAIRDAIDDTIRKIDTIMQKMHGQVKSHPEHLVGKVVRLFEDEGFGFIDGADGEEYYFNADNVTHNRFKQIDIGTEVSFVPAVGNDGMMAHRVSIKQRSED